jgi:HEAT repeat protein
MTDPNVDELFDKALSGDEDDDDAWKAVAQLHQIPTEEVLHRAIALTSAENPYHRARGADILGQLGRTSATSAKLFLRERVQTVLDLLHREQQPLPLSSAICALGHINEPEAAKAILPFHTHENANVRWYVAAALQGDEPETVEVMLRLMKDEDSDVRDWATFALGTQSTADSPSIREALIERTTDSDADTRAEAIMGLAERKDLRVIPALIRELQDTEHGSLLEEAADLLLQKSRDKERSINEYVAALTVLNQH